MIKILKHEKYAKMVTDMGIEKALTISPGVFQTCISVFSTEKAKSETSKSQTFIKF